MPASRIIATSSAAGPRSPTTVTAAGASAGSAVCGSGRTAPSPYAYQPRPLLRPCRPDSTSLRWASDGVNLGLWRKDSHTERVTASLTSWPMRSVSSKGPMAKPPLSRRTASMVAGSAPRSSYTAKASA